MDKYIVDDNNKEMEYNLLNGILRPKKREKNINSLSSPVLHGCMDTRNEGERFRNFQILLYSGCSNMIIICHIT